MVIGLAVVLLALGLVAVHVLWPAVFGVFIAIGGTAGALMVIYEVRLTKRIAQAEFIRDLQTSFSSDANIGELWRKVLLDEEITYTDRAMISNYLTFFETLTFPPRGTLDLGLIDDLFRNRFFKTIGNTGVLETALAKEAGSFANIHDLIQTWHDYLLTKKIPMHPGYYRYVESIAKAKGYEIGPLEQQDLNEAEDLHDAVRRPLTDESWVRANPDVGLKECLLNQGHVTLGARKQGKLVAAAVLYDGGASSESIRRYFTDEPARLNQSINLKLVLNTP